jgi:hypothetical protein
MLACILLDLIRSLSHNLSLAARTESAAPIISTVTHE